uniref:Uncharacterized protein n=1 Tax=Sphaerodactylus townsendi TaxID=933632 RepID=A0ACB8EY54_9SAUR
MDGGLHRLSGKVSDPSKRGGGRVSEGAANSLFKNPQARSATVPHCPVSFPGASTCPRPTSWAPSSASAHRRGGCCLRGHHVGGSCSRQSPPPPKNPSGVAPPGAGEGQKGEQSLKWGGGLYPTDASFSPL